MSAIKSHVTELAMTTGALATGMAAIDAAAERWLYQDEPSDDDLRIIDAAAAAVFVLTEDELASIDASIDAMPTDDDEPSIIDVLGYPDDDDDDEA